MGYRLGVDVGTTFTAAAVDDGSGPRMVGLGNRALQVPSVVFLQADGTFLFGEAAERRGALEPARLVREFKRRFGDTVPILVAGQPFSPQALTARLLSYVIAAVTEREGAAPEEVVLTHPANWGGYKRELMDQVIRLANVSSALTCTEPEAAAIQYASRAGLAEDAKVAVYDLGGGTFDICVLAKQQTGFRILGAPEGVEHLGGIDFDEAVFQHVLRGLGEQVARLDLDDPQVTTALARLRRDCVEAKEALSNDVDTAIPVTLPGLNTTVRLTRAELESLITPAAARHPGRHPPSPSVGADQPRPARRDRPGRRQLPHPSGQPPAPQRVRAYPPPWTPTPSTTSPSAPSDIDRPPPTRLHPYPCPRPGQPSPAGPPATQRARRPLHPPNRLRIRRQTPSRSDHRPPSRRRTARWLPHPNRAQSPVGRPGPKPAGRAGFPGRAGRC